MDEPRAATIHAPRAAEVVERAVETVPPMVEAIDALDRELERYSTLVELLGQRLTPVLSPFEPDTAKLAVPEDGRERAPLVEGQRRQTRVLDTLNDRLSNLLDRIEV